MRLLSVIPSRNSSENHCLPALLLAATTPLTNINIPDEQLIPEISPIVQKRLEALQAYRSQFTGGVYSFKHVLDNILAPANSRDWVQKIIDNPNAVLTPTLGVAELPSEAYQILKTIVGIPTAQSLLELYGQELAKVGITLDNLESSENLRMNLGLKLTTNLKHGLAGWLQRKCESVNPLWNADGTVNNETIPSGDSWTQIDMKGIGNIPIPKAYMNHESLLRDYFYGIKRIYNHPTDNRPRFGEFDFDTNPTRFAFLLRWWERNFVITRPGEHDKGYAFSTNSPFLGEKVDYQPQHEIFDLPADAGRALNDVEFTGYRAPVNKMAASYICVNAPNMYRNKFNLDEVTALIGTKR